MGVQATAGELARPVDGEAVLGGLDVGADRAEPLHHRRDPIRLLVAELLGPRHDGRPLREAAEQRNEGQLVDGERHLLSVHTRRLQGTVTGEDSAHRLDRLGGLLDLDRGPHPVEDAEQPDPGRIQAHTVQPDPAALDDGRRRDEEGGGGEVTGHHHSFAAQSIRRLDRYPAHRSSAERRQGPKALGVDVRTPCGEQALGVVARRRGLGDLRLALGQEAREEHARLHLRARNRQAIGDPVERPPGEVQRGQPPVTAFDRCAHPQQRLGNAVHRAAADRLVAVERPLPCALSGQPAGEQAQQRPGVADIDAPRAAPGAHSGAAEPDSGDLEIHCSRPPAGRRLDARAEPAHGLEGRLGVGRVEVPLDLDRAVAHRPDQGRAMADRLVGRGAKLASERSRGGEPRHVEIETVWPRPRTISAARSDSASPATHRETAPVRMSGAG